LDLLLDNILTQQFCCTIIRYRRISLYSTTKLQAVAE